MLKNLKSWQSSAGKNAVSSLLAFGSSSLSGLVSIPVAIAYLSKEEIGLWSLSSVVVSYLLWLDLGIGNAVGRKIAASVAVGDTREINRWWTLSVTALGCMGLLMISLSLILQSFVPPLLGIPAELTKTTSQLFLGVAAVGALGMPLRVYPGMLLAQDRFHWVSIGQIASSWVQLILFFAFLHLGHGVHSYLHAYMISQLAAWSLFVWQVHAWRHPIRVDLSGLRRERASELLRFSSSLAASGLSDSIVHSIPTLILARFGGLHLVPAYNLTQRGPQILNNLSARLSQAFYPGLQKSYLSEGDTPFSKKYSSVCTLSVWLALASAAVVLVFNRTLVQWLGNEGFYAGHGANVMFACAAVLVPFITSAINLLQISGDMGKIASISLIEPPLCMILCYGGYVLAGMAGMAAAYLVVPLLKTVYAARRGGRNIKIPATHVFRNSMPVLAICVSLVLLAGWLLSTLEQGPQVTLLGRATVMPAIPAIAIGLPLFVLSATMSWKHLKLVRTLFREQATPSASQP